MIYKLDKKKETRRSPFLFDRIKLLEINQFDFKDEV